MPSAVVTGATGMTGTAILHRLLADSTWTDITSLSRSKSPPSLISRDETERLQHKTLDLTSDAETMASALKGVSADYVFFCAYLADGDEAKATRINGNLLRNFLEALHETGAMKGLRRFILVNGLKQYGVHLGVTKSPCQEDDQWVEVDRQSDLALEGSEEALEKSKQGSDWPPNFYYAQQRILAEFAERSKKDGWGDWSWVVTYPQDVIGFAKGNFMNLATSIGLYAAVSAEIGNGGSAGGQGGEGEEKSGGEIPFPGSRANYMAFNCWTSANCHAEFCLWAALEKSAANQGFNVVNGDTDSWQNLWPKLVYRFGGKVPKKMFPGGEKGAYPGFDAKGPMDLHKRPPIDLYAEGMGMEGEFGPSYVFTQIDLVKWAERKEVIEAWERLRDRHDLEQDAWEKATWEFLTFVLGRAYSCVVSMSKARRLGWTGYHDTWETFEESWHMLEKAKMLPPMSKNVRRVKN